MNLKKLHNLHVGIREGGGQLDPSPLLLTSFIQLTRYLAHIMSILCKYFQLIKTTCCLIGFHGNHSNIMTSLAAAILDFQIFIFFSYSNLYTENSEKQHLAIGIYKIVKSIVKLSVFRQK